MWVALAILVVGLALVGVVWKLGTRWLELYRDDVRGEPEPSPRDPPADDKEDVDTLDDLDDEDAAAIVGFIRQAPDDFARMDREAWIEEMREEGLDDREIAQRLADREPIVIL